MKKYLPFAAIVAVATLIPLLTSLLGVNYYLTQLTMAAYYALVALGLCVLMGFAGQISLGQAGFFSIGGYASALLTTNGVDPWLAFLAAIALAAAVAVLIGIPVLKLKGHYLAMATLGFGVIIEKLVRGTPGLGGADGLSSVPPFGLFGEVAIAGDRFTRVENYAIAWIVVALCLLALVNLLHSRAGRALRALHGSEEAAAAMGVDVARYKLGAFVLAAVFAAAAGSLLTHYNGSIGPGEASVMKSVRYVAIVAVGGMSNIWATLGTGVLLTFLSLRGVFGVYDDAVFGAILVLVMLFAPEGFVRSRLRKAPARAGRCRPGAGPGEGAR